MKQIGIALILLSFGLAQPFAQSIVDVNVNVKHTVGNISTFDRNKFVTIHADIEENDWNGDNALPSLIDDVLAKYDVYLGRNTGGITWNINNNITQDRNRSGFADSTSVKNFGRTAKSKYGQKTSIHKYEKYNDQVLAAQLHPFWPDGQKTKKGWAFSQKDTDAEPFGTATGEYMAHFISNFYGTGGTSGALKPKYLEVINEPIWHLTDFGTTDPALIFKFHNGVIDQIKKRHPEIAVGGYCTAFPDHDKNNFQEWEQRWKLYMDIAGEKSDFWAVHLYDFPSIGGGKKKYRKGSNMEATFDMMEQYSYLQFGKVKPFMVSEFGAQMHDYNKEWSPYRDWLHVKSSNAMMMQFMERPNLINKTINFIPLKAEWGKSGDVVYNHRLMRKTNEPTSYTGQWIYSDMMKIYELWSGVKGTRVETYSEDQDIMVDTYVDGTQAYIVITNLEFEDKEINLNILGADKNIATVNVKHLYLKGSKPVIDYETYTSVPKVYTIGTEGSVVFECIYSDNITINESCTETKYYATSYYKSIVANKTEVFSINNVQKNTTGEVILRLGLGRDHGKSLQPTILFNGTSISIPTDYRGGVQKDRDNYFGVIEIPVDYDLLQDNNQVSVTFTDGGGKISSVALQVFNHSKKLNRSELTLLQINVNPSEKRIKPGKSFNLTANALPNSYQNELQIQWSSSNEAVATVNKDGRVTAIQLGDANIIAKDSLSGFTDSCKLSVTNDVDPILATALSIESNNTLLRNPGTLQVFGIFAPEDVDDTTLVWSSEDESIATVDQNGLVTSISEGKVNIVGTTKDGSNLTAKLELTVPKFSSSVYCPQIKSRYGQLRSYTFTIPYNIGTEKDILVSITTETGINAIAEARKTVQPGKDSVDIQIQMDGPLNLGNYKLWVRLIPVGGKWFSASSTCSQPFEIANTDAVKKIASLNASIYPNPTTSIVFIKSDKIQFNKYQIFNLSGVMVQQGNINVQQLISVAQLTKGMYFLSLQSNRTKATFKLYKQ